MAQTILPQMAQMSSDMKKILEVLLYGENDVRFNTDMNPEIHPEQIEETLLKVTMAMLTKLWGSNETAVLAMIRTLAIADLSLSVNRKEMIRNIDCQSEALADAVRSARREMERQGKIITFGPGIVPPKTKS